MSALTPEQIMERLSVRNGMRQFEYFVGRQRSLTRLAGVHGQEQSAPGWIHGPRRMGKSSLALELTEKARERGSVVVYADTASTPAKDFEAMLAHVLEKAPSKIASTSGGTARKRFAAMAQHSEKQPIVIILDEFDHIAINLGTDEQAFLRQLKEEHPRFGYVFITRLNPALLVEEISDERSRLLGICNLERLSALERREVHDLYKRLARDLNQPGFEQWYEVVWNQVGGYPVAVQILTHALVAETLCRPIDENIVQEVLEDKKQEVQDHLSGLWRDLQPGTRTILLNPEGVKTSDLTKVKQDGFCDVNSKVIRPGWLLEVGKQLGQIPPEMTVGDGSRIGRVERLHQFILAVNENVMRLGYKPAFALTIEMLRYFWLTRTVRSEEQVRSAVDHLFKVLVEGARLQSGDKGWRLPKELKELYCKSDGYQQLVALRNFASHDAGSRDEMDAPSFRYKNQGEVFRKHSGQENPDQPSQWKKIRDGLVDDLVEIMAQLEERSRTLPPFKSPA